MESELSTSTNVAALNKFVIALAISIVEGKPDELSISEHISDTHQTCLRNRRSRGLDRTGPINPLERTITNLEAQLQAQTTEIRSLNQKQRQLETLLELANDDHLIAYAQSFRPLSVERTSNNSDITSLDIAGPRAKQQRRTLLSSILKIETLLRQDRDPDTAELTHHLLQLPAAILALLDDILIRQPAKRRPSDVIQATMTACARASTIMLKGCRVLSTQRSRDDRHRQITFAVIDLFRRLLDVLETLSSSNTFPCDGNDFTPSRSSKRASARIREYRKRATEGHEGSRMLVALILHTLPALEPAVSIHQEIFEGVFGGIMSRVGQSLFHGVFGHLRGSTIEDDIRAAGKLDSTNHAEAGQHLRREYTSGLVSILEQALALAPAFLSPTAHQSTNNEPATCPVVEAVKQRLQRILVDSIFDIDPARQASQTLGGYIAAPEQPIEPAMIRPVTDSSTDQWLHQEVWRVIGWEILAQ